MQKHKIQQFFKSSSSFLKMTWRNLKTPQKVYFFLTFWWTFLQTFRLRENFLLNENSRNDVTHTPPLLTPSMLFHNFFIFILTLFDLHNFFLFSFIFSFNFLCLSLIQNSFVCLLPNLFFPCNPSQLLVNICIVKLLKQKKFFY